MRQTDRWAKMAKLWRCYLSGICEAKFRALGSAGAAQFVQSGDDAVRRFPCIGSSVKSDSEKAACLYVQGPS